MKRSSSYLLVLLASFVPMFGYALRFTLPSNDGNPDISLPGSTQMTSNPDLVLDYVSLINRYLWIAMVVVAFVVVIWIGFKLMTNKAGTREGTDALKQGLTGLGVGVAIILFSYAIVRLIINIL